MNESSYHDFPNAENMIYDKSYGVYTHTEEVEDALSWCFYNNRELYDRYDCTDALSEEEAEVLWDILMEFRENGKG